MQTTEKNPPLTSASSKEKKATEQVSQGKEAGVSSERAFADFVFGSVILHAFCVNFIN